MHINLISLFFCFRLLLCKACLGTKDEARVQEALDTLLKVHVLLCVCNCVSDNNITYDTLYTHIYIAGSSRVM